MEKIYKPLVIVLLAAVVGLQAFALFVPRVTPECQEALDYADRVANSISEVMLSSLSSYENAVYERADNINQQTFLALEETYIIQQSAAHIQYAQLRVMVACQ